MPPPRAPPMAFFLLQNVSVLVVQSISSCVKYIFLTFIPVILKIDKRRKVDEGQIIQSNVDTYGVIIRLYYPVIYYLIFIFIDSIQGGKSEQSNVATYVIRSPVYFFNGYIYLAYVYFIDGCHKNYILCLFYSVKIHIYQACAFWAEI